MRKSLCLYVYIKCNFILYNIFSFKLSSQIAPPLPLLKENETGGWDGNIYIILKLLMEKYAGFFRFYRHKIYYDISLTEIQKSMKYHIPLHHFHACAFCLIQKKGKHFLSMTSIRSLTPSMRTKTSFCREFSLKSFDK